MRFFAVGFAVLALASAGVVPTEYLPPLQEVAVPNAEYLPPSGEPTILADDGYRYKTVRRLRLRHRRDVNEINNEYLPPVEESAAPIVEVAPVPDSAVLTDDGYRYRTVKRYRLRRRRRDVNEINNEYLPPVEESAAPIVEVAPVPDSAVLADDGYRYRTVKRYRLRRRRDVNEINNEYLPPVEESAAPIVEVAPVPDSAVLADDGYRYRTVKRYRLRRRRRDVNEINNEYLPPVEGPAAGEVAAPIAEVVPVPESAVLANDGYRYRTVKRYRLRRRRRDVNEINNEYLPPVEGPAAGEVAAPIVESAPVPESSVLANDGYRYKTVRKLRYRYRH